MSSAIEFPKAKRSAIRQGHPSNVMEDLFGCSSGPSSLSLSLSKSLSLSLSRREILAGFAALGAAALLPKAGWAAQMGAAAPAKPFRIDVHHHFSPPPFEAELNARHMGNENTRAWQPQKSLDAMDQAGIATAIVSITRPGIWFGDDAACRKLARECNEFGARMMTDHPDRFGLFAVLPLPDVNGTLRELEYGLDTLKADGVSMMSNHAGKYLGDPAFAPVMDELNRRKTIVYVHPVREDRDNFLNGIELVTDTTRTIASLLYNQTVVRCPDIRFIMAHAGGTISVVTGRMGSVGAKLPKGLTFELQKFYYDIAQAFNPYVFPSLKALVPAPHILFGTDYLGGGSVVPVVKGLHDNGGFSASDLRGIERDNALALFPRFKS